MNECEKLHTKKYNPNYKVKDILNRMKIRDQAIKLFSWAVPNDKAISTCVKYNPLVEIGAGKGYWASLIREAGGKIHTYDKEPGDGVVEGTSIDIYRHAEANLFLCWPPYDEPMAFDCLKVFRNKYVIYVGEGNGGCTGCDEFHELLREDFNEVEVVCIPQWYGLHDYLTVWWRK